LLTGVAAGSANWYTITGIPAGVANISTTALEVAELTQLQNIGSAVIGSSQWTRLQHLDQSVSTTASVTFATASLGGLTVTGDTSMANVSSSANVSVTGNVSANMFIGDGSLLTNIDAGAISGLSADQIVSGTTSVQVN